MKAMSFNVPNNCPMMVAMSLYTHKTIKPALNANFPNLSIIHQHEKYMINPTCA